VTVAANSSADAQSCAVSTLLKSDGAKAGSSEEASAPTSLASQEFKLIRAASLRTRLQGGAIQARIFPIFSTKNDEKSWHASGLLGAEIFFFF